LIVSAGLAVCFGPVAIAPARALAIMWSVVAGGPATTWPASEAAIVLELRLPRVLLGALVGAILAVVGCTLQTATRNKLADPYLFGISSGAALGVVSVSLWGGSWASLGGGALLGPSTVALGAFAGALAATGLVTVIAGWRGGLAPDRLILAGVAVSFVLMAATNFLLVSTDQRGAAAVLFWMLGGLGRASWALLAVPLAVTLGGLAVLLARARDLNALLAGDETATSLGVGVARLRLELFVVCALMTGTAVAVSGAIGFVGLMLPHMLRPVIGADHRVLLPAAALAGASFLIWVDVGARTVLAPEDLPIGIVTAAIGGLFFLWQMARRDGA
jgi:iron complex transport system permease protein